MIVEDLEFSEEINKDKFIKINGCGSWEFESINFDLEITDAEIDINLEVSESISIDTYPEFDLNGSYPFDFSGYTEEPGEAYVATSLVVH